MSEPTATELDAALAEVRVRAVPIARRRARNRGAGIALAVLILGGLAAAAGRSTAPGLRLEPSEDAGMHGIGGWTVSRVAVGDGAVRGPTWRWRVAIEERMEGVQLNAGDAWIEGPEGITFDMHLYSFGAGYQGRVRVTSFGDSSSIRVSGRVIQPLGELDGMHVEASSDNWDVVWLRPGEGALVKPFGSLGDVKTTLRVEGPFAAPPEGSVRWMRPDTQRVQPLWRGLVAEQDRAGIRWAHQGNSPLRVQPVYFPPVRLRFTLRGHNASEPVTAAPGGPAVPVRIPGLDSAVSLSIFDAELRGTGRAVCLSLRRPDGSGAAVSGRSFLASGCFADVYRWQPIELRIPQASERLLVEVLPAGP